MPIQYLLNSFSAGSRMQIVCRQQNQHCVEFDGTRSPCSLDQLLISGQLVLLELQLSLYSFQSKTDSKQTLSTTPNSTSAGDVGHTFEQAFYRSRVNPNHTYYRSPSVISWQLLVLYLGRYVLPRLMVWNLFYSSPVSILYEMEVQTLLPVA